MKKKGPASQFVQNKNDEHNFGTRDRTRIKKKGKLRMRTPWCAKSASRHPFLLLKEAASSCNLYRRKSHMPQRRKKIFGNNGEDNSRHKLVDKISALPDEILLSIVSLLPLKDAVATSILSKRWRYVGTSTMNLNFDAKFEVGERKIRFIRMKPELRFLETRRYVDGVNNVLLQHRGPAIVRFRVCFDIDGRFACCIDKWVQFAMNKGVKILELVFHLEHAGFPKDAYPFPSNLLGLRNDTTSNLKPRHTDILSLRSCGYKTGFKFLEVLHFRYVDVSGEVLEYFLSNCPVLERLTVFGGQKSLDNLRVVGPSVALKHLEVMCCISLKSIEICDACLVSFKYDGHETDLVLSNVPLLVEVSISETLADTFMYGGEFYFRSIELHFTQLSCCLSQLKVLMLDIDGAMYNPDLGFPILSNLEHLELIVAGESSRALSHLNSFMKAAPYLQRLLLKFGKSLGSCEVRSNQERVEKFPHQNLKVVEIIGYRARKYALEHVMYLIKCAVALERVVIDPVRRWDYPGEFPREMDRGAKEVREEHQGRDHAKQHLKEKIEWKVSWSLRIQVTNQKKEENPRWH